MISLECRTEISLSEKAPLTGITDVRWLMCEANSNLLCLSGIASFPFTAEVSLLMHEAKSNLLSLVDRDEMCSSNRFRYKESRYCSKYLTSNSNIPISLISSFAA